MKFIFRILFFYLFSSLLLLLISCERASAGEDSHISTPSEEPVTTIEAATEKYIRPTLPEVSLTAIPDFSGGASSIDYDCGDGEFMRFIAGVSKDDYDGYLSALGQAGYSELKSSKIGSNYFASFAKDSTRIYAYYTKAGSAARIVVSPYDPEADARVNNIDYGMSEVLLTQVGLNYSEVVNGMSYILRSTTGSFIVIDGGWAGQGEAKQILDILTEQNEEDGKPIIAAWILTHPHSDHIGAISEFSQMYHDKVVLQRVIWNFPSDKTIEASDSVKMISEYNSYYAKIRRALNNPEVWGGVELVKCHTGENFNFDGIGITILQTHEDTFPNTDALKFMNSASLAFMLEYSGNRILFLGDCTSGVTSQIFSRYGNWLKCDYLQPTHHGSTGGNLNLYKAAAPSVTLWCSSLERFEEYKNSDFNKWLLANCPEHYYSGNRTETLTLKPRQ